MTVATQDKHDAYATHQRENSSDREIEARALLSCARTLDEARNGKDLKTFADAVQRNQRLWTIFQVALCDPENPLSRDLKTILLNISHYVDKMSFRALAEFKPALLTTLIDINRRIAAGLSARPRGADIQAPGGPAMPPTSPGAPVTTTA